MSAQENRGANVLARLVVTLAIRIERLVVIALVLLFFFGLFSFCLPEAGRQLVLTIVERLWSPLPWTRPASLTVHLPASSVLFVDLGLVAFVLGWLDDRLSKLRERLS